MKRITRYAIAAALIVAAQQAPAQGSSPLPGRNLPGRSTPTATPPTTTTPPPATTPPATSPLPGTTAQSGAADPNAANTMQTIHHINVRMIQWGQLAQERGTTSNVKDYGKRLVDEHQRLDRELTQLAQKRGIALTPAEQVTAGDQQNAQSVQNLRSLNGLAFDRAFIDAVVGEREQRVPELKQLRDRTPGRDAELKKWVDEMEVLMEKTRNESRDVRQAVRQAQQQEQRQGRKP